MQSYISPFRNLGIDVSQEVDKSSLNLAKKRLLAELDLSKSGTILRGGVEMTKNDVIQLFDGLSVGESMDFHRQIALNPELLAFLEHQRLDRRQDFVDKLAFYSADFKTFVNPYLVNSCINYLTSCFKNAQSANLHIFPMSLLNQLPINDLEKIWQSVESFLKQKRAQADTLTDRIRKRDRVKIGETKAFMSPQFVACLNWLPDRFHDLRTGYVASLFHLAESCWAIKAHRVAVDILRYAEHINCIQQNKLVVQARLNAYENSLEEVEKSATQERAFKYVMGAIAAIIFLVFVFSIRPNWHNDAPEIKEDRTFRFEENMIVADTIPLNDSIPLVSTDFQKILHNPNLPAKEKSRKSQFLMVRIEAIKKDSTNKNRASAVLQFITSFKKEFDAKAAEDDPSVKINKKTKK